MRVNFFKFILFFGIFKEIIFNEKGIVVFGKNENGYMFFKHNIIDKTILEEKAKENTIEFDCFEIEKNYK